MRFILVDWGTTRFRAFLVDGETIVDRVSSDEGVSALREGQHREVFLKHCR
ncbi:MAG: 2-dehydro-3-deoxygalactonokinase, partial [Microvirga sp.]